MSSDLQLQLWLRLLLRLAQSAGRPVDVLGIGECSQDLVLTLPAGSPLSRPLPDKLRVTSLESLGGGQIATALVAARRLGRSAAFCGAVGDDATGREVLAELQREGVDVRAAQVCPGTTTRTAVLLVDEGGERAVLEARHPGLVLEPAAVAARVAAARVVHVDGTFPAASIAAAREARRHGTLVSLDLDRPFPGVDELLGLADLCAVSARFPSLLAAGDPAALDEESAALLLRERAPQAGLVLLTRGEHGCLLVDSPAPGAPPVLRALPAFVPPVLRDTTACGDTFHAALLVALLRQSDEAPGSELGPQAQVQGQDQVPDRCIRFAQAAAALKCRDLGRRGCPSLAEVTAFLSAEEPA